ncbi:MAG: hypothetical protein JW797_04175 [Bradymonadales bacterium]|nr:hypothetical protein [Bradymonadales bacterium]
MTRSTFLAAWLASAFCLFFACGGDSDSDGDQCAQLTTVEKNEVGDALSPVDLMLSDPESSVPGLTFEVIEIPHRATVTCDGYTGPETGVSISGSLDLTNVIEGETATLSIAGLLTLTGGELSEVEFDLQAVLPWDPEEVDFAGPPTSISGSITPDHLRCDVGYFPDLVPGQPDGPDGVNPQFVVAAMNGTVVYSEDGSEWGYPNVVELETDQHLYGIGCDQAGVCVAVGGAGVAFRSTDGVEWDATEMDTTQRLTDVAACAGTWIAVGDGGIARVSTDGGQSWAPLDTGTTANLESVACFGDLFLAVGDLGVILTDSGTGLTPVSPPPINAPLASAATDGEGTWVVVGLGGSVVRSEDNAQSWQQVATFTSSHLAGIAYGGGRFFAVGPGSFGWGSPPVMFVSSDGGLTFLPVTLPAELMSIEPPRPLGALATDGSGRWSVMSNGGDHLLSVDDGNSWQVTGLDLYGNYDIAYRTRVP